METRGIEDVDGRDVGTEALKFTPTLRGSDASASRLKVGRPSPLKVAVALLDFLAVCLAFFGTAWIAGLGSVLRIDVSEGIAALVLASLVLGFFPSNHLYNYHYIFLKKRHAALVLKAWAWSSLTLGTVLSVYAYPQVMGQVTVALILSVGVVAILILSRFYWDYLLEVLKGLGLAFVALGIIGFLIPGKRPVGLELWYAAPLSFFTALAFLVAGRCSLVNGLFATRLKRLYRKQLAIIGTDEEAKRIASHIVDLDAPYWVTGFLCSDATSNIDVSCVGKHGLGDLRRLPQLVKESEISEVVVTDETLDKVSLISLLDYCTSEGLTVWFPPKLMPIIEMKLNIDSFCGLPMVRLCSQKSSWIFNKAKYALDALVTLPSIIVLLPFYAIIGAAVKLSSPGPVFYRARAIGKNGTPFTMYKFRSMRVDGDARTHKDYVTRLIKGEIRPESSGAKVLKVTDDPRITPVGRIIRKLSLDELPQLINVLKGDMSLVGPRPCLPYEYEVYEDWHKKRLSIRPGITGLWQVAGRSAVAFEDMVLLDLYYLYNRSLSLDMNIIYETVFAVLGKKGAY
jgi:exopolysaccharide biosynthesis polyprenyl glycosylphosphotransferase